jgi:hypothetical protein
MIRTIWLAAVCLAALGAVTAGKVFTSAATIHETLADGVTVDAGLIQEPLTKADRLQITYVHQEAPAESALQPIEPVVLDVPYSVSREETNIVSRHWHDPNAMNSATAKSKQFRRTVKEGQIRRRSER